MYYYLPLKCDNHVYVRVVYSQNFQVLNNLKRFVIMMPVSMYNVREEGIFPLLVTTLKSPKIISLHTFSVSKILNLYIHPNTFGRTR